MSEPQNTTSPRSAGQILREARQAQGVHIAVLAAMMKVSQRKLEALEADRFDELPDPTFTRALAQAVCRALKVDPAPVLALLPLHAHGSGLEHVAEGLKQPFDERAGRHDPPDWVGSISSPAVLGVLAILVLTVAVWLLPQQWIPGLQSLSGASAPAPAASSTVTSSIIVPAAGSNGAASAPAAPDAAASGLPAPEPAFPPAPGASAVSAAPALPPGGVARTEATAATRP